MNLNLKKNDKVILCFLAGFLLLVLAVPIRDGSDERAEEKQISEYAAALECQLEQALENIEGIGEVYTMITLEPLIDDGKAPDICGVLVVARCGDSPVEILKIQETVMTLFQIEAHRIKVMKLK